MVFFSSYVMLWAAIVVTRPCPKRLATPLQIFLQHETVLRGERTFLSTVPVLHESLTDCRVVGTGCVQ